MGLEVGGGIRRRRRRKFPVWKHRSSTPLGLLPKKDWGKLARWAKILKITQQDDQLCSLTCLMFSCICMLMSKYLFSFFKIRKKNWAKWAYWAWILKTPPQMSSYALCYAFLYLQAQTCTGFFRPTRRLQNDISQQLDIRIEIWKNVCTACELWFCLLTLFIVSWGSPISDLFKRTQFFHYHFRKINSLLRESSINFKGPLFLNE